MSVTKVLPVDDILQQYRISALNTPLAAYEMTSLDKEMGNILSRTGIPKNKKMKMYFEVLNKFRDARDVFQLQTNPNVKLQKQVENTRNYQERDSLQNGSNEIQSLIDLNNDTLDSNGQNDTFVSVADEDNFLTDMSTSTPSSSASPGIPLAVGKQFQTPDTKKKKNIKKHKLDFTDLNHFKDSIHADILENLIQKSSKLYINSPSKGGELQKIGTTQEVDSLLDYFLSKNPKEASPKFGKAVKRNNKMKSYVADFLLNSKYVKNNDDWQHEYPVLNFYSKVNKKSGNKTQKDSVRRTRTQTQSGEGKNKMTLKINFKEWDKISGI